MYLMYVDESGDPGRSSFSSQHYILTGLVISQADWLESLSRLKTFRKSVKEKYNLNQRTEIHASELIRINKIEEYRRIRKTNRINIMRDYCSQIPVIFDTSKVICVCLRKEEFPEDADIYLMGWTRLIQRFDTYLKKVAKDKGIVIADDTDGNSLMKLMRKMRVYNPVKSHYSPAPYNSPTDSIIEDVVQRSSHHSYFIQTVDIISHLLYRREFPKGSLKKFGLERLFPKLRPILLLEASKSDPLGIVRK